MGPSYGDTMNANMHDISLRQITGAMLTLADNAGGGVTSGKIAEALTEYADSFIPPEDIESLRGSVDDIDTIIERLVGARKQLVREESMRRERRTETPAETAARIALARRGA
jgi:hypothetical protein